MGLDSVELVMRIEDEFGVEMSNAEAEKIMLAGDLHAFVMKALSHKGEQADEAQVWSRVREIIVEQLGVRPEEVTPTAHFIRDLGMD